MTYNGTIYRPPVEANTFLLPITEGCTHNSCTFCNMFLLHCPLSLTYEFVKYLETKKTTCSDIRSFFFSAVCRYTIPPFLQNLISGYGMMEKMGIKESEFVLKDGS